MRLHCTLPQALTPSTSTSRKVTSLFDMCNCAFGAESGGWGMRAIAAVLRFVTLRRLAVVDDIDLDTSQALRNAIQEYVDPLSLLVLYSVL
jgi:hypothetical protein